MLLPMVGLSFAVAGMTSPRGRSHTFDSRADGFCRGEACSVAALQAASPSTSLVVCGSAVRQDGKSASLTAPNGVAQQQLLRAALADAVTDSIAQLETHGTGTALGDPIEARSLAVALLETSAMPLALGGVKANCGHGEPAAAMTGLLVLTAGLSEWK